MKQIRIVVSFLILLNGTSRAVTYPFSTIDMPGFYKLASNVSNQITISASDVTLDMNGGTVSGGTNGIVINAGLNNVTIKNGTITSVSDDGIQINSGCTDITLKNIVVSNALIGLNFEQVTNALIRNCDFNQSTTGIQLDTCQNIVLQNCTANANTHAGYDLIASTTCSVFECQALATGEGNTQEDAQVFGYVSSNGNGNIFEQCIANSTMAFSATGDNSIVAGFALRNDESCTKIIGCEASNSETSASGFAVPHGILLEGILDQIETLTGAISQSSSPFPFIRSTEWSPDGRYNVLGGEDINATDQHVVVLDYDYIAQAIGIVSSISFDTSGNVRAARWSPDGNYIVAGLALQSASVDAVQFLQFDRTSQTLNVIGSTLTNTDAPRDLAWSPDQNFVAMGGTSGTNILQVISFDRATGIAQSIVGALGTTGTFPSVESVDWSPDGRYIAIAGQGVGGGTGDQLQVFSFDAGSSSLTSEDGALGSSAFLSRAEWSPDGKYLAVGGEAMTEGTGNPLQIFSFDRTTDTLATVTGIFHVDERIADLRWSPDGKYIVTGGFNLDGGIVQVLRFDRSTPALVQVDGLFNGIESSTESFSWAPDGQSISFATTFFGLTDFFNVISGIQFPENNVIQANTVYCNSGNACPAGVGISAPSITNLVIGNSAFNNPIPRGENAPIVTSNYHFVTNVFDQLFGEGPALTQNISTDSVTPQATVPDVPSRIKRTELLLESLIDNLL